MLILLTRVISSQTYRGSSSKLVNIKFLFVVRFLKISKAQQDPRFLNKYELITNCRVLNSTHRTEVNENWNIIKFQYLATCMYVNHVL